MLLLAVATGALAAWPLLARLRRSPRVALYVLGLTGTVNEIVDLPTWVLLGLQVRMFDVASGLVLVAALARLLRERRRRVRLLAMVLLSVYAVALVRGLLRTDDGADLAFSDHLLALGALLYGLSTVMSVTARRSLYSALQHTAGALIGALVLLQSGLVERPGGSQTLSAASALIIGVALLATIDRWRWSLSSLRTQDWLWAAVLAASLIVLQHRTVWVAMALGLAMFAASSIRMLFVTVVGSVALVGLIVLLDIAGLQGSRAQFESEGLVSSLQAASEDSRTWEWRRQRWVATIETNTARGLPAVVVGSGYGTRWVEFGPHASRTEGPHSQYVELAVRYGLVGLVAWIYLYVVAVRSLYRRRGTDGDDSMFSDQFLCVVLGVQLAWSVTYSLVLLHPLLLGLAVSASMTSWRPLSPRASLLRPPEGWNGRRIYRLGGSLWQAS